MTWLSVVKNAFSKVVQVGTSIANATTSTIYQFKQSAKQIVDSAIEKIQETYKEKPRTVNEWLNHELRNINNEIMFLREQYFNQGLTESEKARSQYLKKRRNDIREEIDGLDQVFISEDFVSEEESYKVIEISSENAHVLQYHVGRNTYNKKCTCCRPMVLQWQRDIATAQLGDFFWACTGWYQKNQGKPVCSGRSKLTREDLRLFAKLDKPELQIPSLDLTQRVLDQSRSRKIRDALESIRADHKKRDIGIEVYRCPIHGENLVLKRKNQAGDSILDEYFLGCPHWLSGGLGCNFMVKLKSPAQVSSVLHAENYQVIM